MLTLDYVLQLIHDGDPRDPRTTRYGSPDLDPVLSGSGDNRKPYHKPWFKEPLSRSDAEAIVDFMGGSTQKDW